MVEQRSTDEDVAGPGLALVSLAEDARWVTWRNESRNGKATKVPYSPRNDRKAKADDPSTWGTRNEAEAAVSRLVNGAGGGIGLQLGVLGDGRTIGGIDLDTCRKADGTLEPWAAEVVTRIGSYTEISPSGTGAKVFFTFPGAELPALRAIMGKKPGEGSGRKWARGKGDHVPSIELYLDGRFFALTDRHLAGSPSDLRPVSLEVLTWLIREAGPAFVGKGTVSRARSRTDSSRSAVAFRKGVALRSAGRSYDDMVEELRSDPETADWCHEKGNANSGRELRRIWDKAGQHQCRRIAYGTLQANLAPADADRPMQIRPEAPKMTSYQAICEPKIPYAIALSINGWPIASATAKATCDPTWRTPWWHCARRRNCGTGSRMTRCYARLF